MDNRKTMKILFATSSYWPRVNGVTVSVDTFAKELRSLGHEVYIFAPQYSNQPVVDQKSQVIRFSSYTPMGVSAEDRLVCPWTNGALNFWVEKIQPDVIHLQTEFALEGFLRKIAKKKKIPVVQSYHTMFEEYINVYLPWFPKKLNYLIFKFWTRSTAKHSDQLIAPTEEMAKKLSRAVGYRNIHVLPTGLDLELFSKDKTHPRPGVFRTISPETKKLLYVGRLGQEKNVQFLFPVLRRLLDQGLDVHLVIIGDGPGKASFQKEVNQQSLENYVSFLGYIPRTEVVGAFFESDVFVFPSKTETQGLVTLESMACGTPVVAIGEMGTKEVMRGDNGGFMVSDNQEEFFEKTLALLTEEKLYQQKAKEALQYVKGWSSRALAEKLIAIYQNLFNQSPL